MSLKAIDPIRFHDYSIDRSNWVLQWQEQPIALSRKTFDLLLYLVDHRDRVVPKDELLEKLWPDQFVEESNLTQHVFLLRKALSRHGTDQRMIQTVPGRGYRFSAPVEEPDPSAGRIILSTTESITRVTVEENEEDAAAPFGKISATPSTPRSRNRLVLIAAAVVVSLAIGGWFGWQRWLDHSGGSPVQAVVVPLTGTTGDAILDTSLGQVFRMDLAQSPYITVVPSSTFRAALTAMMRKTDDPVSAAVAREICERTNSQAVLSGNIARAGQHFLITEEATNCVDGTVLGQAKYEAQRLEELPSFMGKLAATLRQELGESRRSIARFNLPLNYLAITPSLDALKAFTQGTQKIVEGKFAEAIALLKTAIAFDPEFASAHYNLAAAYISAADDAHARESIQKAYALRDRATKPTEFGITALYNSQFTGDLYELVRNYQSWADLYPNSSQAWSGLSSVQSDLGMDVESLASIQRTVQLLPHSQGMLANLTLEQMRNNDPQAARATAERAIADNLDGDGIRLRYLQLAYLLHDTALVQAQRAWLEAHPQSVGVLAIEYEIAMAEGRFRDARQIIGRIHEIRLQQGLTGPDDESTKDAAIDLMESGDFDSGKKLFEQSPVDINEKLEILGLAYTGDFDGALSALRINETKQPRSTKMNLLWSPAMRAAIAMAEHKPAEAAALLEAARPFDKYKFSLQWLRGNAYLASGDPVRAEREYRSVIAHPEFEPASFCIPLSWLGLGRALAREGKPVPAIEAYKHFLVLWTHADADAAFLVAAKSELKKIGAPASRNQVPE